MKVILRANSTQEGDITLNRILIVRQEAPGFQEAALMRNISAFLLFLCSTPSFAETPGVFTAYCSPEGSRRYDSGDAYDGSKMGPSWTKNESFFNEDWVFAWSGGESMVIHGESATAFPGKEDLVVALQPSLGPVGGGVWTYAVNLQTREILATQVLGGIGGAPFVSGRLVQLSCNWKVN